MFGYLEHVLVSSCHGLTPPPADINRIRTEQMPAYLEWYAKMEASRTDALRVLTDRFIKLLKSHSQVPHAVREDLCRQLNELRPWRNALCHGAWFGVSADGVGSLNHYYNESERVMMFPQKVALEDLADLRARLVDTIFRVTEAASVAGHHSVLAAVLPRRYEPRNAPPERE